MKTPKVIKLIVNKATNIRQVQFDDDEPKDMDKLYTDAWESMPYELRQRATGVIFSLFGPRELEKIRAAVVEHGLNVWTGEDPFTKVEYVEVPGCDDKIPCPISWHFTVGMSVRNELRKSIPDAELPPFDAYYGEGTDVRNWDDYYVQTIEAAAGCRI